MKALVGTNKLLKLSLRIDRIKLPVWIVAAFAMTILTTSTLMSTYDTVPKRIAYATATAPSAVTRLIGGAITGPSIGEISIIETFMLTSLFVVLINVFLITRHTRQNEESGRSEVFGSMEVGRQASLTSALILAAVVNIVLTGAIFLSYAAIGYETSGALLYSAGLGLLGLVFAGIAAITSQLFESTRTANGSASLLFGFFFIVKGVGDAFGSVNPDRLSATTSWMSWMSPLGWVTNAEPFAAEKWWVLWLLFGCSLVLIALAYALLARRDVGSSIFMPRLGRAKAQPRLLRRFGVAWRLNRGSFIGWTLALAATGAMLGAVADDFADIINSNPEMQEILASIGGGSDVTNIMFSAMFTIVGLTVAAYALQTLVRMKNEETSGRLEVMLSTKLSRVSWLTTQTIFTLIAAAVILCISGIVAGATYGLIDGNVLKHTTELGLSILVHMPAVAVVVGVSLVIFGLLPRRFTALSWLFLTACLVIYQLGPLLELPQWLMNLSPFSHTPAAPAADIVVKPLIILSALALGLCVSGIILFRRRDVITD